MFHTPSENHSPDPHDDEQYTAPERSPEFDAVLQLAEVNVIISTEEDRVMGFHCVRNAPGGKTWGSYSYTIESAELQQSVYRAMTLADSPAEAAHYLCQLCHHSADVRIEEQSVESTGIRTEGRDEASCIIQVQPLPSSFPELLAGRNPYCLSVSRMNQGAPYEELRVKVPGVVHADAGLAIELRQGSERLAYFLNKDSYDGSHASAIFRLMELFQTRGSEGISSYIREKESPEEESPGAFSVEQDEEDEGALMERERPMQKTMDDTVASLLQGSVQTLELITGAVMKLVHNDTRVSLLLAANPSFSGDVLSVSVDLIQDWGASRFQENLRAFFDVMKNERYQLDQGTLDVFWDVISGTAQMHAGPRYGDIMDRLADEIRYEQNDGAEWLRYVGTAYRDSFNALYQGKELALIRVPHRPADQLSLMRLELNDAGEGRIECSNQLGGELVIELNPYTTNNSEQRFDRQQVALDIISTYLKDPSSLLNYKMSGTFSYSSDLPQVDEEGIRWSMSYLGSLYNQVYGEGDIRNSHYVYTPQVSFSEDGTLIARVSRIGGSVLHLEIRDGVLQRVELQDKERMFRVQRDLVVTDCSRVDGATLLQYALYDRSPDRYHARRGEAACYLRSCAPVSIENRYRWYANAASVIKDAFKRLFRRSS